MEIRKTNLHGVNTRAIRRRFSNTAAVYVWWNTSFEWSPTETIVTRSRNASAVSDAPRTPPEIYLSPIWGASDTALAFLASYPEETASVLFIYKQSKRSSHIY